MRVDQLGDLGRQGLLVFEQLALGDEFAHTAADHVDAQDRTVLHRDNLNLTLGTQDLAPRVAGQVVGEGGRLDAALLGRLGGDAHRGDLGLGVGDAGYAVVVDRRGVQAAEPLGDEDALGEADVRELQRRDQVADGGDGLDVGAAVFVDLHETALDLDADLHQAQTVGDRATADRDEHDLGGEGLAALQRDDHAGVGVLDALVAHAQLVLDAALAERPLQALGAGLLLQRQQVGQRLHDGHLGAERAPDAGELHADHTAAEHGHRLRGPVEDERVVAGDHPLAVDVEPGQRAGHRAGGQDDVAALVRRVARAHLGRADEADLALDDRDALGLAQAGEARHRGAADLVLVGVHARQVDAVETRLDAEGGRLTCLVGDLGGVQQRLGRDAAAVEARAAQLVLLDEQDALAQLHRAQRAGVAAAATT